jgi:class 3 adenylate cyclase
MTETRKIAAILVSDVVGYSRLAGVDEERTLAALRVLRADVIGPAVAAHNGRIVKSTGDGSLVEFRSAVDSVRCALEVQTKMAQRNARASPDRRIVFRVGIHVGDVVEEDDGDLMGDGVNIAARLEGVAKPGAICLSEDAYRQVKAKLDLKFHDLGKTQLKNIAEPMRVYSLGAGAARGRATFGRFAGRLLPTAGWIVSGGLVAAGMAWLYFGGGSQPEPALPLLTEGSPAVSATATPSPPEPPRRSSFARAIHEPQRALLTPPAARPVRPAAPPVAPTPAASANAEASGWQWRHGMRQDCILMGGCLNAENLAGAHPYDRMAGPCAHGARPEPPASADHDDLAAFGDATSRATRQAARVSSVAQDGCL